MNAPTYIDKNLGKKRDEEKMYELHTKKLKEIQQRGGKKTKTKDNQIGKKLKENKDKTYGFIKSEKNAEINRENKILLDKLVEISNGKFSSVGKATKKKKKNIQTKKSLNYEKRKKEFERIERENMAIAQRLYNKESSISKKKMDKDYDTHKKYRKQIQKLEGQTKRKGKGKKDDKNEEDKDQLEEEKGLDKDNKGDKDNKQEDNKDDQIKDNEGDNLPERENKDDSDKKDQADNKDEKAEGEGKEGDKDKNYADYEPDYKIE